MGEYRFWLSAIPKNHQRVGKKMGRQKNGVAKKWSVIPWFLFFCPTIFLPTSYWSHKPSGSQVECSG
jgi:hypothetical protein